MAGEREAEPFARRRVGRDQHLFDHWLFGDVFLSCYRACQRDTHRNRYGVGKAMFGKRLVLHGGKQTPKHFVKVISANDPMHHRKLPAD